MVIAPNSLGADFIDWWTSSLNSIISTRNLELIQFMIRKQLCLFKSHMHIAVRTGSVEVCKLLIENDKELLEAREFDQSTPLHRAAGLGHVDIVDLLLKAGANPNAQDVNGNTPFHWGVIYKRDDAVRALMKVSACQLGLPNYQQRTVLSYFDCQKRQATPLYLEVQTAIEKEHVFKQSVI